MASDEATVDIDLVFGKKPGFGDVFTLTGRDNPRFPPSGAFDFTALAALGYDQIDDYFGVPSESADADDTDVLLWLFPSLRGVVATHHPGPFDGVRLSCDLPARGRRWLLLERSVEVLLPLCNADDVDGVTIARGAPLDRNRVLAEIAAVAQG